MGESRQPRRFREKSNFDEGGFRDGAALSRIFQIPFSSATILPSPPLSLSLSVKRNSLKIPKAIFRGDPCNAMWSRLISNKRIYPETEFHSDSEYSLRVRDVGEKKGEEYERERERDAQQ